MHSYKEQVIPWHKNIPENWATTKIKNQCQIIPSNVDKKSYDNETTVNLCNYTDVYYNDFIDNSIKFMIATANEHEIEKFRLIKNDVIITKDSEDPSDIAVPAIVVETTPKLLCGYHLSILRPIHKNKYSGSFLFWALKDLSIVSQLHKEATGITRWAISNKHVKNCLLPLAPFDEQKRISTYLDKACASIDTSIDIKRKQLDTLKALRKSIIHKAVTRGLDDSVALKDSAFLWMGSIPTSWKIEKLKHITELIIDGTHFTPTYVEEGIPFLRVTDLHTKEINLSSVKYISQEEHQELIKRANPKFGDILLSKNGTIGLVKVVDWEWEFSIFVSLCLIRLQKKINSYFFSYYFDSDVVDQQLFESSKRTSVTNLHLVKIKEMIMPVPSKAEQKEIVDYLDKKTGEIEKLKTNISTQIATLENYRKSLIHECVTGKRRITEDDIKDG